MCVSPRLIELSDAAEAVFAGAFGVSASKPLSSSSESETGGGSW